MKKHDWLKLKELTFGDWLKIAYGMIGSTLLLTGIIVVIYNLFKLIESYFGG